MIVLGDFNASPDKFGRLQNLNGISVVVPPNIATNTAKTKNYDNIVFNRHTTTEYLGGGVIDLMAAYNLSYEQALQVSDHLPVWATFRANEMAPAGVAGGSGGGTWR